MSILLTENAAKEVKRILQDKSLPQGTGLRVGVKGGGCSGFSYSLTFDANRREDDQTVELHGVPVFCDPKSFLYLEGTTIDFKDSLMGRGFVFQNPNAKSSCGCGESFSA